MCNPQYYPTHPTSFSVENSLRFINRQFDSEYCLAGSFWVDKKIDPVCHFLILKAEIILQMYGNGRYMQGPGTQSWFQWWCPVFKGYFDRKAPIFRDFPENIGPFSTNINTKIFVKFCVGILCKKWDLMFRDFSLWKATPYNRTVHMF